MFHFRFILFNLKIFGEIVTTDCFIIFAHIIIVFVIFIIIIFFFAVICGICQYQLLCREITSPQVSHRKKEMKQKRKS